MTSSADQNHQFAECETLAAALAYAELGWRVHPLPPGQKAPPLTGWQDLATTDPATVENWWTERPTANVAVATGADSGIVVIDIDDGDAGDYSLAALQDEHGTLPATVEQFTGVGRQLFFRHPGETIKNRVALAENIDVRGDGGYVVVPPSTHPNGKDYVWEASSDPTDGCELADRPAGWINLLSVPPEPDRGTQETTPNAAEIPQGKRNDVLFKMAASMRARGFVREAIKAALDEHNRQCCRPPLPDDEVRRIWTSASQYKPDEQARTESHETTPVIVRASSITPRRVAWLWPGRFAIGKLSIIVGDPGTGKSHLAIDIASRVSTGAAWPDNRLASRDAASVVLLSGEDDAEDTIVPRLLAALADIDRILIVQGVTRTKDGPDGRLLTLSLERDLPALESAIKSATEAKLVVVDPLTCFLGGIDSHKNSEVRGLLAPLSEMASRLGVAVVTISHLNKSAGGSPLYRVMGSLAFCAAARSVWAVTKDKGDPSRRLFLGVKNNLSRDTQGLAYSITNDPTHDVGVIAWEANPVSISADEALAPTDRRDDADRSELDQATAWLRAALAHGSTESKQVFREAKANGISEKTLRRAAAALGIKPEKSSFDGPWAWSLPQDGQDPRPENVATLGKVGHLGADEAPSEDGQPLSQNPQYPPPKAQDYEDGQHLKDGGTGQLGSEQFPVAECSS